MNRTPTAAAAGKINVGGDLTTVRHKFAVLRQHCDAAARDYDAIERTQSLANPGDVVLFSPGCSSFDMFRDFEDRGDQFRALVQAKQC